MKKKLLIILITVMLLFTGVFFASAADKKAVDISTVKLSFSDCLYKPGEAANSVIDLYDKENKLQLKEGTHYKVTYKNNKNVGVATAVVTGVEKKGYTGKLTVNYNIMPRVPAYSRDPADITDKSIKMTLSKPEEVTGFTVKITNAKDYDDKKEFVTSDTTILFDNLKPETKYEIRIDSYTDVNGKRIKSRGCIMFYTTTRSEGYVLKKYSEDEKNVVIDNVSYFINSEKKYSIVDGKTEVSDWEYAASYTASGIVPGENETVTDINVLAEVNGLPVTECYLNYTGENYEGFNPPESTNYPEVKRITLPTTLRKIGRYCFVLFPGVEELVIPEGVKEIDKGAFGNMTSLKKVYLPGSLEYIPSYAFKGCISLEKAVISSGVKEIGYRAFESLPNLKEVVIGEGLEKIAECAFIECKKLKNITLPESLVEIGMYAFARSGLKEITIPENCIYLGSYTFSGCEKLKKVTYNYSYKAPYSYRIKKYTFKNCKSLEAICFTALSMELDTGSNAFKGCSSLKHIYYFGNRAQWYEKCMTGERASTYDKYQLHCYYDHVHSYIEIGQIHTCKKGTTVKLRCSCGDEYEYVLKNTNTHSYTSWKVVKKATLKENGKVQRTCTVCEKKQTKKLVHVGNLSYKTNRKIYEHDPYDPPTPRLFVKDGEKTLTEGNHYKITYKNNDKPGYGIIVVKGVAKNGYYGTTEVKFPIQPYGVYYEQVKKVTKNSATITWKDSMNLDGYTVYLVDNKTDKRTKLGTTDKCTYTVKNLKSKTSYRFLIIGYLIADGDKIESKNSYITVKTK